MAEVIRMPKMSDTMEEGVIASWLKKEGDQVSAGDILAEVETDKATMELESYQDGTLLYIGVKEKEAVAIDGLIAIIGKKGEDISALKGEASTPAKKETPAAEPQKAPAEVVDTSNIKASVIRMPKMSDTMSEGVISSWLKKVGDKVSAGDILAEVETDKATMELESYEDGTLLYTAVEAGKAVAIDGIIAIIGEKNADYKKLLQAEASAPKVEQPVIQETTSIPAPKAVPQPSAVAPAASAAPSTNGRILASPLAKKIASEKGIELSAVTGSGDGGRIIKKDIENFIPGSTPAPAPSSAAYIPSAPVGQESFEDVPATQMRKAITRSLTNSQFGAPHFYLTMEFDMDKTMEARVSINELAPVKISFNDIIIKAVAAALKQHPAVNTYWMNDTNSIRTNHHISIGVAMAVEDGLVVPVVKFADGKSLAQISAEVKDFGVRAKAKKLQLDEMTGNTFTVSNLGMFGIEEFTSIINAPESCILAVGAIKQTPVVKNGEIVPGNVMKVTLTCDHRTVDGATGAAFLQTLKGLVEDPVRILI